MEINAYQYQYLPVVPVPARDPWRAPPIPPTDGHTSITIEPDNALLVLVLVPVHKCTPMPFKLKIARRSVVGCGRSSRLLAERAVTGGGFGSLENIQPATIVRRLWRAPVPKGRR